MGWIGKPPPAARESMKHREQVGGGVNYDLLGAYQFCALVNEGLKESNTLLDIGCGPLRAGRLFIQYLQPHKYYGIDPAEETVKLAIDEEVGWEMFEKKSPAFDFSENFKLYAFDKQFDFILSHSVFIHLPLLEVERCMNAAKHVMHGASKFLFTFLEGERDNASREWEYPQHVTFRPDTLKKMAARCGLEMKLLDYGWPHAQHRWARLMK